MAIILFPSATPFPFGILYAHILLLFQFFTYFLCRTYKMNRLPTVPEKAPHFFKIIFSSIIEDRRLRIPPAFTRKFLGKISDVAVLSVPTDKTWNMHLKKEKDEIWFQEGLHEFLKYYCVCVGHLLLFKYEGNSHFFVRIFDMSATEIIYADVVANKGRRYLNLATKSMEPEPKAGKSKVIDEFDKKGKGKESFNHRGNARKLDCESKRSGENQKESRDFGSNGLKELCCDKRPITEDNEDDDSIQILDVFPCQEKVTWKKMIAECGGEGRNKLDCLQNKCDNNHHSLRLVANRSKGKVDFSSRLRELGDKHVVYANGVKFRLCKMKKERVEEMEQARELVDKSKGNEEVIFVFDDPTEDNTLQEQNCGKKSNCESEDLI